MSKAPTEIRSLARAHTEVALKTLAGIASNGQSESARVAASVALLDRGWGKAEQRIEAEHVHRYVARVPDKAASSDTWQQQHKPALQ